MRNDNSKQKLNGLRVQEAGNYKKLLNRESEDWGRWTFCILAGTARETPVCTISSTPPFFVSVNVL
jgi:hypothetical protein